MMRYVNRARAAHLLSIAAITITTASVGMDTPRTMELRDITNEKLHIPEQQQERKPNLGENGPFFERIIDVQVPQNVTITILQAFYFHQYRKQQNAYRVYETQKTIIETITGREAQEIDPDLRQLPFRLADIDSALRKIGAHPPKIRFPKVGSTEQETMLFQYPSGDAPTPESIQQSLASLWDESHILLPNPIVCLVEGAPLSEYISLAHPVALDSPTVKIRPTMMALCGNTHTKGSLDSTTTVYLDKLKYAAGLSPEGKHYAQQYSAPKSRLFDINMAVDFVRDDLYQRALIPDDCASAEEIKAVIDKNRKKYLGINKRISPLRRATPEYREMLARIDTWRDISHVLGTLQKQKNAYTHAISIQKEEKRRQKAAANNTEIK
jgi:hypothetical protein